MAKELLSHSAEYQLRIKLEVNSRKYCCRGRLSGLLIILTITEKAGRCSRCYSIWKDTSKEEAQCCNMQLTCAGGKWNSSTEGARTKVIFLIWGPGSLVCKIWAFTAHYVQQIYFRSFVHDHFPSMAWVLNLHRSATVPMEQMVSVPVNDGERW